MCIKASSGVHFPETWMERVWPPQPRLDASVHNSWGGAMGWKAVVSLSRFSTLHRRRWLRSDSGRGTWLSLELTLEKHRGAKRGWRRGCRWRRIWQMNTSLPTSASHCHCDADRRWRRERISFITEWILSTGLPQRPWRGSQRTLSQTKSVEGTRFDYEKLSASPDPEGRSKLLSGCGWEIPLLLPRTPSRLDKRELAFLWFGGLKGGTWKLWRIVLGLAKEQRAELEKPKLGFRPEG